MTVPLSAQAFIASDGRQLLRLWRVGGELVVEPSPVTPYVYADLPSQIAVERKALSTLEPATWYVHRFKNEREQRFKLKAWQAAGVKLAETRASIVERVLVDEPDYFRKHGAGRPKVMYVDIEQLTDGTAFPAPEAPIISIAWAIDDGPVHCVYEHEGRECGIVDEFALALETFNPDIIVGFNLESYDLPVLHAHGVALSRDGSAPTFKAKKRRTSSGDVEAASIQVAGRVVFDVRWPAELDMSLSGISDRKLKTIAEWLDLPHVAEDASNTAALSPDRLRAYNVSDVELLRTIAKRYLPDKLALAEFVGAPYDSVLNGGSSFAGGIMAARVNAAAGIVSDGSNGSRYAEHVPEGAKFEGATVALHKQGRFAPVWKADYASLYPTLMVALGAGPDNTRIVYSRGWKPNQPMLNPAKNPLRFIHEENGVRRYVINDMVLKRTFEVDVIGRSAFAEQIAALMRERLAVKAEAKQTGSAELDARAGMLKIILNSVYGGMGADHAAHGSKAVAMLVTAGGRAMVDMLAEAVGREAAIETDTDGVYFDAAPHAVALTGSLNYAAERRYAMRPVFAVDVDRYDAGYFYKAKSYGLLEDGSITWYGGAFKGSVHPPLFRRVIDEVGGALLRGEPVTELAVAARDLSRYEPEAFIKRVKWSGNPNSSPGAEVAESIRRSGREPAIGERMTYVKTLQGYESATEEALSRLDAKYYLAVVDKALQRLGVLDAAKPKRKLRAAKLASSLGT